MNREHALAWLRSNFDDWPTEEVPHNSPAGWGWWHHWVEGGTEFILMCHKTGEKIIEKDWSPGMSRDDAIQLLKDSLDIWPKGPNEYTIAPKGWQWISIKERNSSRYFLLCSNGEYVTKDDWQPEATSIEEYKWADTDITCNGFDGNGNLDFELNDEPFYLSKTDLLIMLGEFES